MCPNSLITPTRRALGHGWGAAAPSPSLGHRHFHTAGTIQHHAGTTGYGEEALGHGLIPRSLHSAPSLRIFVYGTRRMKEDPDAASTAAAAEHPRRHGPRSPACSSLQSLSERGPNSAKAKLHSRLQMFQMFHISCKFYMKPGFARDKFSASLTSGNGRGKRNLRGVL